jgi:hypothetical protein
MHKARKTKTQVREPFMGEIISTRLPHLKHFTAHELVVENPRKKHAICLEERTPCPSEDSGGVWGYYRLFRQAV